MAMFVIVPGHEAPGPFPGRVQIGEPLVGNFGRYFAVRNRASTKGLSGTGSPFLASGVPTIVDADGVILGKDVRHAEFVGRRFPQEAFPLLHTMETEALRLKSIDGTERAGGPTSRIKQVVDLHALAA